VTIRSRVRKLTFGSAFSRHWLAAYRRTPPRRIPVDPQLDGSSIMGSNANAVHREPWNKGKIVVQKAPFKVKDI
jgi:hypothetical protein